MLYNKSFLCGSQTPAARKLATLKQCALFPVLAARFGHVTGKALLAHVLSKGESGGEANRLLIHSIHLPWWV